MKGIILIVITVTLLAACNKDEPKPSELLLNEWTRLYEASDTTFHVKLTFRGNGTFSWEMIDVVPTHTNSAGEFTATDDEITLFNDLDCDSEGIYSYSIVNDELEITLVSDDCNARTHGFSGVWEIY